jgi:rubredoxin
MTVGGEEFLRRFLLHVLPRGFVRIRFFGFLANRRRSKLLPFCQRLPGTISHQRLPASQTGETKLPISWLCPHCGGAMVLIEKFTAQEIRWKLANASHFVDSS